MAKVGFYLSEREKEWVREQGPGWFRMVVKKYMRAYPDGMPEDRPLHRPLPRAKCPECGSPVNSGATTCTRPDCRWER